MKILFAGTPANAARTLQGLVDANHEIVAVLTRQDAPVGRKKVLTPSPVAQLASQLGIKTIKANSITPETEGGISALGADLAVVVAYGTLLKQGTLDLMPAGWFNLHYSLLPHWRGAAPVQSSLLAGDQTTGVSLFKLDEGMDTGPLVSQVEVEIQPRENSGELLARLTEIGISILVQELPMIAAGLATFRAQENHQTGSLPLASKPRRHQAQIDWNQNAINIERQVRAFNPEPMAFTYLKSESFRVLDALALGSTDWAALSEPTDVVAGQIVLENKRVLVHCGQGTLLELKEVQPAGKKAMSAIDWARGNQASVFEYKGEID